MPPATKRVKSCGSGRGKAAGREWNVHMWRNKLPGKGSIMAYLEYVCFLNTKGKISSLIRWVSILATGILEPQFTLVTWVFFSSSSGYCKTSSAPRFPGQLYWNFHLCHSPWGLKTHVVRDLFVTNSEWDKELQPACQSTKLWGTFLSLPDVFT